MGAHHVDPPTPAGLVATVAPVTLATLAKLTTLATHGILATLALLSAQMMNKWYCGQPANKLSLWCKRTDLVEKIEKLSTDAATAEERKQRSMQASLQDPPKPPVSATLPTRGKVSSHVW